jgi:hypothetical protein
MVYEGSTITRSPFLVVTINSLERRYCSATSGEMLDLNSPVPTPRSASVPPLAGEGKLRTEAHNDLRDEEDAERGVGFLDHTRDGRDDEDDVSQERDADGDDDGVVAPEVRVGDVRADEWRDVAPAEKERSA